MLHAYLLSSSPPTLPPKIQRLHSKRMTRITHDLGLLPAARILLEMQQLVAERPRLPRPRDLDQLVGRQRARALLRVDVHARCEVVEDVLAAGGQRGQRGADGVGAKEEERAEQPVEGFPGLVAEVVVGVAQVGV